MLAFDNTGCGIVRARGNLDHLADEEDGVVHEVAARLQDQRRARWAGKGRRELLGDGFHVRFDGQRVPALGVAIARL
jgi:hypothetical protein